MSFRNILSWIIPLIGSISFSATAAPVKGEVVGRYFDFTFPSADQVSSFELASRLNEVIKLTTTATQSDVPTVHCEVAFNHFDTKFDREGQPLAAHAIAVSGTLTCFDSEDQSGNVQTLFNHLKKWIEVDYSKAVGVPVIASHGTPVPSVSGSN